MTKVLAQHLPSKTTPKTMGKILIQIFIGILAFIMLVYLGRNFIIKTAVEIGVRKSLGLNVHITSLKLNFSPVKLEIKGLVIYNPPGFQGEVLCRIPYLEANFDLKTILAGKLHLKYLDLNIDEVSLVKNQNKELNFNRIKTIAAANSGPSSRTSPPSKSPKFQINLLVLTIEHIKYIDYSKIHPKEHSIGLGIYRERFTNLHSIDDIVRLVAVQVVMKAGLYNIGLPFRSLENGIQTGVKKTTTGIGSIFKKLNPFKK